MSLFLTETLLHQIYTHGEHAYPEEGAGLLIGSAIGAEKRVLQLLPLGNSREDAARHNRYLLTPQDYLRGEEQAARQGLDVLGIFHSHPDHPNLPSEFDRDWALPWLSYIITSVRSGKAVQSRSWLLAEDRSNFTEETLVIVKDGANQDRNKSV